MHSPKDAAGTFSVQSSRRANHFSFPRHRELASSTPPNAAPLTNGLTWSAPSTACLTALSISPV